MSDDISESAEYGPLLSCPVCCGSGFVHPLDSNGAVMREKIIPCVAPGCLADSISEFRSSRSFYITKGIRAAEQTFQNFQHRQGTETSLKFAQQFAQGNEQWIFLLIYGGVGNGKTHLCNAIAKAVLGRGLDVSVATTSQLLSKLRIAMQNHTTDDLLDKLKHILVLIVDDWGVEYGSDWEKATLEDLLTSRYATGMPTVVTTNLDMNDLPVRVRSRFEDKRYSRIAHNAAPDFRATSR